MRIGRSCLPPALASPASLQGLDTFSKFVKESIRDPKAAVAHGSEGRQRVFNEPTPETFPQDTERTHNRETPPRRLLPPNSLIDQQEIRIHLDRKLDCRSLSRVQ
jgi:hypothetical protein